MITSNVIHRTFHLKLGNQTATGFVIDVDDRQYLITAKHFARHLQKQDQIEIYINNKWTSVRLSVVGNTVDEIDISVVALEILLAHKGLPLVPDMDGLIYGQDVFFLGFPFGLYGDVTTPDSHFTLPFVKGGIVSCFDKSPMGHDVIVIDAINNKGFSGGPVVFKAQSSSEFKIASVISGFRYNIEPVYQGNQELPISIRENTGLVISYPIRYAVELIKKNPIGRPLPS